MKDIIGELLDGIENRGRDATGVAWFGRGGGLVIDKTNITATQYIRRGMRMSDDTSTAVLHTRLATTGSPADNRNNHPIPSGTRGKRVVLTHNGWVNNDGALTKTYRLDRRAEVDSEVIAALLAKFGDDYDQLGALVNGNYALGYLREDQPGTLFLVRGHSSPLVLMQTKHGVFYASTEFALRGIQQYVGGPLVGWQEVVEGRTLKVKDGEVVSTGSFDLLDTWSSYRGNQVHRGRTNYVGWTTDDYTRQRRWTVDNNGVAHVGRTIPSENATLDVESIAASRMFNMWTDTNDTKRVYVGQAAAERKEFFGIGDEQGSEVLSAYGKYVNVAKRGDCIEFHPWTKQPVDEAAFEDLLFSTDQVEEKDLPDSIRYELTLLRTRLDRKTHPGQGGVRMGDSFTVDHGYLIDGNGHALTKEQVPHYSKVQGVWYYKQDVPATVWGYQLEVSAYQRDSDHIRSRAITPPAGKTSNGEETDFALIGEYVYTRNEESGVWEATDTRADELTEAELMALGYPELVDDDYTLATVVREARLGAAKLG